MGPGPMGPPPWEQNDKLKEPKPKSFKEIPSYIKKLIGGFFYRLFYIFGLVWEAKPWLLLLMIFMAVFNGIMPVVSAYISANLLNHLAKLFSMDRNMDLKALTAFILPPLLLQFGYMFFNTFVNSINNIITRISGELVTNHVKVKIMNKAKEIDVASFDMPDFYERLENANREAGTRPIQILSSTFSIASTIISMVSFIVILYSISWFAPLIIILLSVPSAIITFSYRKKNFRYMRRRSKDRRQMNYYSDLLVNKDMVKEVRLFGLSDNFIGKYLNVFKNYFKGIKKLIRNEGLWNIALTLITTAVNCGLFFYIAYSVYIKQSGQIGDYSLYTGALGAIASGVATFVATTSSIYEGTLFIDNMILFMNEKKNITSILPQPAPLKRHTGHIIEFKDVSFRYPGTNRDVLKNINLTINPGDSVVMVGLNGAGKTTLLKLLTRLYDPTGGVIMLDGRDIREYDVAELYKMFGIIFQDFGKYALNVSENIALGQIDRDIVESQIRDAAIASDADDFIGKLPDKYQTPLMRYFEDNAIELSIGQWQKLAIARAFYSDSDILILDEPTASLDAIAEQEIFRQFDELRRDKTTIFVSHRLSSATIASMILVLEDGELIETGTHAELMRKKGRYYKLFSTQAKRYITTAKEDINSNNIDEYTYSDETDSNPKRPSFPPGEFNKNGSPPMQPDGKRPDIPPEKSDGKIKPTLPQMNR